MKPPVCASFLLDFSSRFPVNRAVSPLLSDKPGLPETNIAIPARGRFYSTLHIPANTLLIMTSHYYNLIGAINEFLAENAAMGGPYNAVPGNPVDVLTLSTNQVQGLVHTALKEKFSKVADALLDLKTAAETIYTNTPATLGTPVFVENAAEWEFPSSCLGQAIYEAIKALHTATPLPGVVGAEIAERLFQIQRLMRPEAPPGGDDSDRKPCWPSCLVSSSSSSS